MFILVIYLLLLLIYLHEFLCICMDSLSLKYVGKREVLILSYPVLRNTQSAVHSIPWQTCSVKHHVDFSGKHLHKYTCIQGHMHTL